MRLSNARFASPFLPPKVSETRSGCPVGVSGFLVSSSLCFVDSSSLRSLPFSKHHSLLFLLLLLLRHHRSPRFARSSSSSGRGISTYFLSARFPAGRPIPVSESAPPDRFEHFTRARHKATDSFDWNGTPEDDDDNDDAGISLLLLLLLLLCLLPTTTTTTHKERERERERERRTKDAKTAAAF